jgi:hypothetical protein
MKTPWDEMSFLEKMWMCVKFAFVMPIGYTAWERARMSSLSDNDDSSLFSDSHSITSSTFDDDGPSRGLWDPTSIYYSSMHDDISTHSSFGD